MGTHYAVSAGHPWQRWPPFAFWKPAQSVDAGVAGGICLAVVHPDIVNFAGVAPAHDLQRNGEAGRYYCRGGPLAPPGNNRVLPAEVHGEIPDGILRTIVAGGT